MGLDITAYRKVKLFQDVALDEDGHPEDYDSFQKIYVNPDFASRAEGLVEGGIYDHGEYSMGFRAGSYSGYNSWRGTLESFGRSVDPEGHEACQDDIEGHAAFWEMVCFSDCEGVIGPVVSAKLAQDFARYDDLAKDYNDPSFESGDDKVWFYKMYQQWRLAFEMAADGGMVAFH